MLGTLARSDIFFFVATISVVVITLALAGIAIYVMKILEQGRRTLEEIEDHVGDTTEDLKDILYDIRESRAYHFLFRKKKRIHHGSK